MPALRFQRPEKTLQLLGHLGFEIQNLFRAGMAKNQFGGVEEIASERRCGNGVT